MGRPGIFFGTEMRGRKVHFVGASAGGSFGI